MVYDKRLGTNVVATGWLAVRNVIQEIGHWELAGFDARVARCRRLLDVVDVRRPVT